MSKRTGNNSFLTPEQNIISSYNHLMAQRYFGIPYGDRTWVLHHKDENLKYTDVERYIEWRPEDLEKITRAEHTRLHRKGKPLPEEWKKNVGKALKGKKMPEGFSEKISKIQMGNKNGIGNKSTIGQHWWTNGYERKMCFDEDAPEGWHRGKKCLNLT